jgi:hypothetical protein
MFQTTAQIVKPIFMADKSMRLLIELGEVKPEEVAVICSLMAEGNIRLIVASEKDLKQLEEKGEM